MKEENKYFLKVKNIAISKGGECISEKYKNSNTKLKFKCSKGHIWESTPNSIISKKSWCKICSVNYKKDTIETFRKIAKEKGGVCLSKKYIHSKEKLEFKCKNGHIFHSTAINIKHNNQWCKECFIENNRSGIKECRDLAEKRGGKCLEEKYLNQHSKMQWQCTSGHKWFARFMDIKTNNQWCPTCSSGIGERICRLFFEEIFETEFPKYFPKWLINDRGNRMELDGYSNKYRIAFEHQGEQHYSSKTHMADEKKLNQRIKDDLRKIKLCIQNDIILICVPEISTRLPLKKIKDFIYSEISKKTESTIIRNQLQLSENKKIDFNKAYIFKPLEPIIEIAKEKKGKLLSKSYLGIFEKLEFVCENNHRFKKSPAHLIHRNQWCPICSKEKSIPKFKEILKLQELAFKNKGELITNESLGAHKKHKWKCFKGHFFESTPANVSQGKWCPTCAIEKTKENNRLKFENKFLKILEERKGKIYEGKYDNIKEPILLICSNKHIWKARPESVFKDSWCPECKKIELRNIFQKKIKSIIKHNKETIIEGVYLNAKSKITIQCNQGHITTKRVDSVLKNYSCKECNKNKN